VACFLKKLFFQISQVAEVNMQYDDNNFDNIIIILYHMEADYPLHML